MKACRMIVGELKASCAFTSVWFNLEAQQALELEVECKSTEYTCVPFISRFKVVSQIVCLCGFVVCFFFFFALLHAVMYLCIL